MARIASSTPRRSASSSSLARRLMLLTSSALLALAALPFSAAQQTSFADAAWNTSWASAQQLAEPQSSLSPLPLQDLTLRQLVHLSAGGTQLRLKLSNTFGDGQLQIDHVHIAEAVHPGGPSIKDGTDRAVTFNGQSSALIPEGAEVLSDAVPAAMAPLTDLAITFHIVSAPAQETSHPGSRTTSFVVDAASAPAEDFTEARKIEHWFYISGVDVAGSPSRSSIAVLGDSITDGRGSTTDSNDRWPDILARRLQTRPGPSSPAIANLGMGGNRVLHDGIGPNALARFDRDVLARSGVHCLIVLEGINDLGTLTRTGPVSPAEHQALVRNLTAAYRQIIQRSHDHGIRVIGATVLPDGGFDFYHPSPENESDRQAVNQWIRSPGNFDAVIDFDSLLRDPQHPDHLKAAFDSGDHIHPSPLGYKAMGEFVDPKLSLSGCQ